MNGVAIAYGNVSRLYSPVTLNREWPILGRLLFVVFCSCLGTTINGFFVAAFFVEHTLNRVGNVFLACIGLSELIVTSAVMPISAVVLLSAGEWDTLPVCHAMHFLTETATYSFSLFFVLVSVENYFRTCRSVPEYDWFMAMRVKLVTVLMFLTCVALGAAGVYLGLDYDYCERYHSGNFIYRLTTSIIFYGIPAIITLVCLIISIIRVSRRAREQTYYKRSQQYERDFSITNLNMTAFLLFLVFWAPFVIAVYVYPANEDPKIYHFVWIGVCRSIFSSFLYSLMNRSFRRAFAHLFYYCCCKSSLSGSFNNRHRRGLEYKAGTGDVRVHIMHQAVNSCSPQRATTAREAMEL